MIIQQHQLLPWVLCTFDAILWPFPVQPLNAEFLAVKTTELAYFTVILGFSYFFSYRHFWAKCYKIDLL